MFKSDLELLILVINIVVIFILNMIYKNSVNKFKQEIKFNVTINCKLQTLLNTSALIYTFYGVALSLVIIFILEYLGFIYINI